MDTKMTLPTLSLDSPLVEKVMRQKEMLKRYQMRYLTQNRLFLSLEFLAAFSVSPPLLVVLSNHQPRRDDLILLEEPS